jgi:hypothetical protein
MRHRNQREDYFMNKAPPMQSKADTLNESTNTRHEKELQQQQLQ